MIYIVTALLPIAYIIGLLFTFRTHSHIFTEEEEGEGEDAPEWSIGLSCIIMVVSVLIFGLIAEDVVEIVEHVLVDLGVEQSFLGKIFPVFFFCCTIFLRLFFFFFCTVFFCN